ncbi:hypothetical protein R3P38DRAFT_2796246 [Favolaschia claudopus]|uniref:Uncharacterized protein n=1 Tax=Favolaschia claudopus TaxID=2862362 RepID=A0AAW0A504_9AGAR
MGYGRFMGYPSQRIIPKDESRHERRDGGGNGNESKVRPYPKPQQGSKPPAPKTGKGKCYSCGGDDYSTDPVCPNNKTRAPILYNGREVVDDNEDEESKPSTWSESKQTSGDATEQFKHIAESSDIEDVENVDGEQYESEYTLEECSEYSEYDDDERCFHLIEEDDDAPELESVSDSDEESDDWCSDSEFESIAEPAAQPELLVPPILKNKPKSKRRELTLEELGLFGVCDDYSDDEFVSEEDVDKLAKEIATCLMETGDPEAVVEYFAAGREQDTQDSGSQNGRKRGVYLRKSKEVRPRPARTKSENFCLTAYVNVNGKL